VFIEYVVYGDALRAFDSYEG